MTNKLATHSPGFPPKPFRVIPVLDLLNGQVVRGIAGRRSEYAPWSESVLLTETTGELTDPLQVARAMRRQFGLSTVYVADLDAIASRGGHIDVWQSLAGDGFLIWLDHGCRSLRDIEQALDAGVESVILGLESLPDFGFVTAAVGEFGSSQLIFSLDLKNGEPVQSSGDEPNTASPLQILDSVVAQGLTQIIVLDIARVGSGDGAGTAALCSAALAKWPTLQLIAGGGIREAADLRQLQATGVHAALVATALHNGRISRSDILALQQPANGNT